MLPLPVGREARAGVGASVYVRHHPERTLLYQLVREYYPAFKALLAAQGTALPGYVEQAFEDYLQCGRLEHGYKCRFRWTDRLANRDYGYTRVFVCHFDLRVSFVLLPSSV